MGAEALLGQGDMLYMPPGSGLPVRIHGAFVSDEEVHRVVEYLKQQGAPDYVEGVLEGDSTGGESSDGMGGVTGFADGESDPKFAAQYDQACKLVLEHGRATTSMMQRYMNIGYGTAAKILDKMEQVGMVSKLDNKNRREILVPTKMREES
jgi:S-DNA-T family DNA segregation ATPase FtsK/SpoIIIE